MSHIVGIAGQLNSGKGAVAEYLCKEYGFIEFAITDYIKIMVQDLFGVSDNELWGSSQSRTPRTRRILQSFGTEFGRNFDPEVWIRKFERRVQHWRLHGVDPLGRVPKGTSLEPIVVPDVRFTNEAHFLCRIMGGRVVRIRRPDNYINTTKEFKNHISETSVDDISSDLICMTIVNSGTLDDLHRRTRVIWSEIRSGDALRAP